MEIHSEFDEEPKKIFDQADSSKLPQPNKLTFIAKGYWLTLSAPFRSLASSLRRKSFTRHYNAFVNVFDAHRGALQGKRVVVVYINPYGQKYRHYPSGQDVRRPNLYFMDPGLTPADHNKLDNHLTPAGHRKVASLLFAHLQASPVTHSTAIGASHANP